MSAQWPIGAIQGHASSKHHASSHVQWCPYVWSANNIPTGVFCRRELDRRDGCHISLHGPPLGHSPPQRRIDILKEEV